MAEDTSGLDTSSIDGLVGRAAAAVATITDVEILRATEADFLGKKSTLSAAKAAMRRPRPRAAQGLGAALNRVRSELERVFAVRRDALEAEARRARLAQERLDLTEYARHGANGPLRTSSPRPGNGSRTCSCGMGFTVADGPEVETDWFNFEALNMPPEHPARSLWDTLYLDPEGIDGVGAEQLLLRTHTSPVQVRSMLRAVREGPARRSTSSCPGRVYRRDTADATHLPVFHQIEGLVVDRGITMADLAGTIESFVKAYFGDDMTSRLRPSYFPFTEPSAEFDISDRSTARGSRSGGCGMVHPNVLRAGGLDPEEWSGFAFGFGIDRLAKIRHGVDDLREFVTNDVRFLAQF